MANQRARWKAGAWLWSKIMQVNGNLALCISKSVTYLIACNKLKFFTTVFKFWQLLASVKTSCVVDMLSRTAIHCLAPVSTLPLKINQGYYQTHHQSMLLGFKWFLDGQNMCLCFHSVCLCSKLFPIFWFILLLCQVYSGVSGLVMWWVFPEQECILRRTLDGTLYIQSFQTILYSDANEMVWCANKRIRSSRRSTPYYLHWS